MWIMTTIGFFSIVQKQGDEEFTVRARCAADLDRLRERVPALGPSDAKAGTDYPFRARIGKAELADAMSELVRNIELFELQIRGWQAPGQRARVCVP
jgi:hypothetical protein